MIKKTMALPPLHPGEVLREEFMVPHRLTAYRLAHALRVPRTRIERLAGEKVALTVDTALRLAKVFDTTPEFWLNLQTHYDMEVQKRQIATELDQIQQVA
jgi:addiction module HigA family antidote